jgi:hypothetical protein
MIYSRVLFFKAIVVVILTTLILFFPQSILAEVSNKQTFTDKIFFINSANTNQNSGASNRFKTYENQTYGIRIEYPSDWTHSGFNTTNLATEQLQGIVMFVPPNTTRLNDIFRSPDVNFRIGVQDLIFLNLSLTQYTNLVVGSLRQTNPNVKIIDLNTNTTIGENYPAHRLKFISDRAQESMAVYTMKDDALFLFRYIAPVKVFPIYLPVVENMIKSFRFHHVKST